MKFVLIPLMALSLLAVPCLAGASGEKSGQEGHGAVVFETGDALRVFDAMEFPQESIIPAQLPEYQQIVKPALETLKTKLPKLAKKMEAMFERGINPRWYLVSYTLRPAHDEGNTHLVVTYEREQVALNDDGIIQIQKKLWDKLSAFDRAILLIHEVIWSTAEDGGILPNSGEAVRKLSTLIVDKNLASFEADQVSLEVGRRAKAICKELEACPLYTLSRNSTINQAPAKGWEDVSTKADDKSPAACDTNEHCVFSDEHTDLYWTTPLPQHGESADGGSWDQAQEACVGLGHWGGVEGWRLPSPGELAEASSNGLRDALVGSPTWRESYSAFWSSALNDSNENYGTMVELPSGSSMRHRRSFTAPWVCVAGDYEKNWADVSVSEAGAPAVCRHNSDHCAFQDRKTGLIWSERSPNFHEEEADKSTYGLTWPQAQESCFGLGEWNGSGGNWRLPTAKEFEAAYRHGFYRVAVANSEGFGRANDTFWLQDWEDSQVQPLLGGLRAGSLLFFDFFDGQVKREGFTSAPVSDASLPPHPFASTTERPWLCVRDVIPVSAN